MIPMTLAGLSKSLNQRFFLVTLAPANPPREGRAKRVNGGIFDSEGTPCSIGGPKCKRRNFHTTLRVGQTVRDRISCP